MTPDNAKVEAALGVLREMRQFLSAEGYGRLAADTGEALSMLTEALAESRRDAARYRWLRDNCKREWVSDMEDNKGSPSLDIDFDAPGHDLDAAIDAAMKETK